MADTKTVKKAPANKAAPVSDSVLLKAENDKLKEENEKLTKTIKEDSGKSFEIISRQEGEIETLNEKLRQFANVIDVQSESVNLDVSRGTLREQVLVGLLPHLNIDYAKSSAQKLSIAADEILKAWGYDVENEEQVQEISE